MPGERGEAGGECGRVKDEKINSRQNGRRGWAEMRLGESKQEKEKADCPKTTRES